MGSVYNPAASILETYINSQKEKLRQEQDIKTADVNRANIKSETDFRNAQAKGIAASLEDEHQKNLAQIQAQKAQLDLYEAQLHHAHQTAKLELQKGILEGTAPSPTQIPQFNTDFNGSQVPGMIGVSQNAPDPNNPLHNAPYTYNGDTYKPGEMLTPQQSVSQRAPIVAGKVAEAGLTSKATKLGEVQAEKEGGLFDQQTKIEQLKLNNALGIANIHALSTINAANIHADATKTAASINSNSRIQAATISGNARIAAAGKRTQITSDELEDRANQLQYGEGPAQGHNQIDIAAASLLTRNNRAVVNPKTIENIKGLKPLEEFSAQMTDFANQFLPTSKIGGALNAIQLSDANPITTEEKNAYNQLLLQSTNIAKGIEGATGRILMKQVETAQRFIANKSVTRSEMIANAEALNKAVITSVDGQLGSLNPAQRVDLLQHHGFNTLAALTAKKYKLADPITEEEKGSNKTKKSVKGNPDFERVQ